MFSVCLLHFTHCHCTTRERKMKERRNIVRERLCLCASVLKKGGVRRQKELDVDVVVVFVLRRQRSNKIIDFFQHDVVLLESISPKNINAITQEKMAKLLFILHSFIPLSKLLITSGIAAVYFSTTEVGSTTGHWRSE